MLKIIATPTSGQINIGKQGENLARRIAFKLPQNWDMSDPAASVQLVVQRAGESAAYPVMLSCEDSMYYWDVTAADTGRDGYGLCELRYLLGDVLAKSMTWATYVVESVGEDMADPPAPGESYVNQVAAEGAKAVAAAEKATAAAVHPPKLSEQYTWMVWDFELGQYVDTGVSVGGSGDGTPGGYYTPVVTQPDAGTMQVAYVPSAGGLPEVPPVNVTLPQGPKGDNGDSGEPPAGGGEEWEVIADVTLEEQAVSFVFDDFDKTYRRVFFVLATPANQSLNSGTKTAAVFINGYRTAGLMGALTPNPNYSMLFDIDSVPFSHYSATAFGTSSANTFRPSWYVNIGQHLPKKPTETDFDEILSIQIEGERKGFTFPVGTVLKIWGVPK